MNYQLNLYTFVLLFAFLQGLFYVYQFCKRGFAEERVSDFWLAGLILVLCITNLPSMLGFMGIYILGQAWWFFPQDTGLIIGPLVYFYLKSQTNVQFKFQTRDYWHFLPYIIYFFYHLLIFLSGKDGIDWWAQSVHNRLLIGMWERIAENVSLLVYMILSLRLYHRYRRWLPTERSDIETIRLGWYKHFLALVVVSVLAAIVLFLLGLFVPLSYQDDWILRAIVAFNICYLSFNGYVQPQPHRLAFTEKNLPESNVMPTNPETTTKKAEKPDPAEVQIWCKKVEAIMQTEKLYLNPELTLSDVSEKLHSHNSWISYVINTGFQKNFNDFVNAYRVADFQKKVNDPMLSHYTLLALAFECGFNSKSTFNRAVKKATGQLPSAFGTKTQ
ncbi:helix-turn-helix domain-containing protein [Haliscomenobacter sp.]|uniref:helix-turn-helix domain-containing protein n=1 Tax=Haliscomenobacter sp. TaxID=2717303 RepID=UPI003593EA49